MKHRELQTALKYKRVLEETLLLQKKIADEIKVYLSYPENQVFSIEYIYGILCGISDDLMKLLDLSMNQYLDLIDNLKDT